ncbi:hypothetical protein LTS18_014357, partial [Coniosporium uncinatum]
MQDMSDDGDGREPDAAGSNATWSETEQTIREVLAVVSKVPEEEIFKISSLFNLGLDSISAIKVSSQLKKRSIKLSVSEILRAATVPKMAEVVDSRKGQRAKPETKDEAFAFPSLQDLDIEKLLASAGIAQANVQEVLPATAGQTYMLSVWQKSAGRLFYPTFRYRLQGSVDVGRLRHAWNTLLSQQPILRTSFMATGRDQVAFIQVIRNDFSDSFTHGDADADAGDILKNVINSQPFVGLHASQRQDHWLLSLTIHHALYDGVSLPLLIADFEKLCNSIAVPPTSNLPFRKLLASTSSTPARQACESFWTNYLSDAPAMRLPQPATASSKRIEVFRPAAILDISRLEKLAKTHGLSVHALFLATYARA